MADQQERLNRLFAEGKQQLFDYAADVRRTTVDIFRMLTGSGGGFQGATGAGGQRALAIATQMAEAAVAAEQVARGVAAFAKAGITSEGVQGFPAMAHGGIVTRPTLALVGESGPEAVVPLSRGGGIGTTVNIVINALDPRSAADAVVQALTQLERTGRISLVTVP